MESPAGFPISQEVVISWIDCSSVLLNVSFPTFLITPLISTASITFKVNSIATIFKLGCQVRLTLILSFITWVICNNMLHKGDLFCWGIQMCGPLLLGRLHSVSWGWRWESERCHLSASHHYTGHISGNARRHKAGPPKPTLIPDVCRRKLPDHRRKIRLCRIQSLLPKNRHKITD